MKFARLLPNLGLLLALPLSACDGENTPIAIPDAATPDMAEEPIAPEGTTCANPTLVTGTESAMTLSFDTTDMPNGARDLGLYCGNADAPRWAPQWVIAYAVPGSGTKAVEFSTAVTGTPQLFDTVVQARTSCETVPPSWPPSCFDNVDPNREIRSSGAITVEGGSTVYLYVTGYTDTPFGTQTQRATDRGSVSISLRTRANTAPVASAVDFQAFSDRYEVLVSGTDAQGDALGASLVFRDAEGNVVDVNGDGRTDGSDFLGIGFTQSLASMTTFEGTLLVDGDAFAAASSRGAASVTVAVVDQGMALGNELSATRRDITEVTIGETCTSDTPRCFRPLTCEADVCTVPAALEAACGAATPIAIEPPAPGGTAALTVAGTINTGGQALFTGTCGVTTGPEQLFTVAIPAEGAFDLVVGTNVSGTAANTDTIVYVRETCAVPATETGCGDDISQNDLRSRVETLNATPGATYTVFVEPYQQVSGSSLVFSLEARLRPVLESGALCDRSGAANRCASGRCPATGDAVCP